MKRILGTFTSSIAFAVIVVAGNASSSDQIAAESKRANEFFDKCWDETLARHPVDESFYGIKTHYDQLEDLSDEKAVADHAVFFFQAEDGIRDGRVTGVQTCALPIYTEREWDHAHRAVSEPDQAG